MFIVVIGAMMVVAAILCSFLIRNSIERIYGYSEVPYRSLLNFVVIVFACWGIYVMLSDDSMVLLNGYGPLLMFAALVVLSIIVWCTYERRCGSYRTPTTYTGHAATNTTGTTCRPTTTATVSHQVRGIPQPGILERLIERITITRHIDVIERDSTTVTRQRF